MDNNIQEQLKKHPYPAKNIIMFKYVKTNENWHGNWFDYYFLVTLYKTVIPGTNKINGYMIIAQGNDDCLLVYRNDYFLLTKLQYEKITDYTTIKELIEIGFGD